MGIDGVQVEEVEGCQLKEILNQKEDLVLKPRCLQTVHSLEAELFDFVPLFLIFHKF